VKGGFRSRLESIAGNDAGFYLLLPVKRRGSGKVAVKEDQ
jgi:hypothetical protein